MAEVSIHEIVEEVDHIDGDDIVSPKELGIVQIKVPKLGNRISSEVINPLETDSARTPIRPDVE